MKKRVRFRSRGNDDANSNEFSKALNQVFETGPARPAKTQYFPHPHRPLRCTHTQFRHSRWLATMSTIDEFKSLKLRASKGDASSQVICPPQHVCCSLMPLHVPPTHSPAHPHPHIHTYTHTPTPPPGRAGRASSGRRRPGGGRTAQRGRCRVVVHDGRLSGAACRATRFGSLPRARTRRRDES